MFIWLHWILVLVHRIFDLWHAGFFSCGMWDLVLWSGIKFRPPALRAHSLSHWTTGKSLYHFFTMSKLRLEKRIMCYLKSFAFFKKIENSKKFYKMWSKLFRSLIQVLFPRGLQYNEFLVFLPSLPEMRVSTFKTRI